MKSLLKNAREKKELKTRELAQLMGIDQALVSKFETGSRKPTKEQVIKLASILEIDFELLMVSWLKEKILNEIGQEEFALKALKLVEDEIKHLKIAVANKISVKLQKLLDEIDSLKTKLDKFSQLNSFNSNQDVELAYTFETNRIEGNTLTLAETNLVVNEGETISGKSMREHLEAINHQEAISYIKNKIEKNMVLNEKDVINIHSLILRGIKPKEAGQYRNVSIAIKEKNFFPPEPLKISKEMEDYFNWYEINKSNLHPVILAIEMQKRLLTIYPFINGNGKVSRLIMNFILLQNGYTIANIKGDNDQRLKYYQALEIAITNSNREDFSLFIAQIEKESLAQYLSIVAS